MLDGWHPEHKQASDVNSSIFSDRNTVRFRGIPDAVTPKMLFSSLQPLFFSRKMGRPLKKRGSQKTN